MQKPRSCLAVQQPGTLKKLQPIFRLIAFLERNLELGNKVCPSVGISCFPNICANGGSGTIQLIDQRIMPFTLLGNAKDVYRKIHRAGFQLVFTVHIPHLPS